MSEDKTVQGRVETPIDLSTLRLSEDLVAETRQVVEHRQRVQSLLGSAEEGRDQVTAEIFARVSADYRRQLDEIAGQYAPLRDRAGEELRRIKRDETRLQLELDQVNDHLEELRFRCRVGEFDEKELRRREAEKLALVSQLQEQLKTIESTFATGKELLGDDLDTVLRGDSPKRPAPAAPAPAAPASPHGGTTPMAKPSVAPPPAKPVAAPVPPAESTSPGGVRGAAPPPPVSEGTVLLATPSAKPAAPAAARVQAPPVAAPPPGPPAPAAPAPAAVPAPAAAAPAPPPAVEGTVLMSLPSPAAAAPAPSPNDSSTQGLPQALLTRKKPDAGKTYVIDKDGLVLGRSNQCDVVVQGATVSRRHAVIRFENGGYLIEDVSSGGGVLVNGQRQKSSALKNGDEIGVGAAVFEFQGP